MTLYRIIPAGDLDLGPNLQGVLLRGSAYVRQKISQRLKFIQGEWFADQRLGVPYYEDIFAKNPNLDIVRTILLNALLSVQEVGSVDWLTFSLTNETRQLAISFQANLVSGGVLLVRQPDPPFIITVPGGQ